MKDRWRLENILISLIIGAILVLLVYLMYELNQVKEQLIHVTSANSRVPELGILKDFMDRNVKVYGTITTTVVTFVIFALGVYINIKVGQSRAEVDAILNENKAVIKSMKELEQSILSNVERVSMELYYISAVQFDSQSQGVFINNYLKIHTIFQSIYGYVRCFPSLTEDRKTIIQASINNQIASFVETLEGLQNQHAPEAVSKNLDDSQLKYILVNAPEELYDALFDLQTKYRAATEINA